MKEKIEYMIVEGYVKPEIEVVEIENEGLLASSITRFEDGGGTNWI